MAFSDAPDSTQQAKRSKSPATDSDAQNAIQGVTERYRALQSVTDRFLRVNQRFITLQSLRGVRRPSKGGSYVAFKAPDCIAVVHIELTRLRLSSTQSVNRRSLFT